MAEVASPQGQTDSPPSEPRRAARLKKLRWIVPAALLIVVAGLGLRYWLKQPSQPVLQLSGRIEGDETDLGTQVGGKVEAVAVHEGDSVQPGQMVVQLDDAELQAQLQAAKASYAAAQQQVTQAQLQREVIQSQIQEVQLAQQQAAGDASGRVTQAEASVTTAQAQLSEASAQLQQAEAALQLAQAEQERFATLVASGAISEQQFDQVQTQLETAQKTYQARQASAAAAERRVHAAQGGLTQARTSELNPDIRTAQIQRLQKQLAQAEAELEVAQAESERVQAAQAEVEARIANLTIVSPIDGVVISRTVEPGEVIAAGTSVITVLNLEEVYLRGYIPEGQVGAVRVGQPAKVFLDSDPEQPLAAQVSAIDTTASFTPENIYFQDDRVTQVFGLKLSIDNPQGFAKPGMPADGEILVGEADGS